jgi:ferredoxin-like protein FixX
VPAAIFRFIDESMMIIDVLRCVRCAAIKIL